MIVAIAGNGHAGFNAAFALRQCGFDGRIALIGKEAGLPYQRPPLSKNYLSAEFAEPKLAFRPAEFYERQSIDLIQNAKIARIDRGSRDLLLTTSERIHYDHLILALGAQNRECAIPGSELDGVYMLRSKNDADALKSRLPGAENIVIVGGGLIGLEAAESLRASGARVRILEVAQRILARAVCGSMSAFIARMHEEAGTEIRCERSVTRIVGSGGRVSAVETDTDIFPADLVLLAMGVTANTRLAREAGLPEADGVIVDETLLTADQSISAIGDCARFPSIHAGCATRIESVQNAADQAKCVAARLTGKSEPYRNVPTYWSDQGKMKLQIAGLTARRDDIVIRGSVEEGTFSVFCYHKGGFIGVESMNRPSDYLAARQILERGGSLDKQAAANQSIDLRALMQNAPNASGDFA